MYVVGDWIKGNIVNLSFWWLSIYFFRANARDLWTVSRYPILRVPSISFVRAICLWLLDSLKDPILRVPSISLSTRAAHYSPSKFLGGFFVGLDKAILPGGVILCRNILSINSQLNWIDPSKNISPPSPEQGYRTKFEILLEGVFTNSME